MTDTRTVVACTDCGLFWYLGAEPAKCDNARHRHQEHQVHRHLSAVVLPDGTPVTGASFDPLDPYTRAEPPDYGLYLDRRWQPPWRHEHLDWSDLRVPADRASVLAGLGRALERARRGERVEVGCLGGHGRTGTALACLAVLAGSPPADAVGWVRANYCADAVETAEQEAFVLGTGK